MIIQWDKWRIRSKYNGYTLYRKKGSQWHADSYYVTLKQAVNGLNDIRIRTETEDCVIDHPERASIPLKTAYLLQRVDDISSETYGLLDADVHQTTVRKSTT